MFKDAFTKLDAVAGAAMTDLVNPHLDAKLDVQKTTVLAHALPFYPGYDLLEFTRPDIPQFEKRAAIIGQSRDVHILNWSKDPLYRLNGTVPIFLDAATTESYIRFFFAHVRGNRGRFVIVDSVDDVKWREEPAPAGRKALAKLIEPMHLRRKEKEASIYSICFVYTDSLFHAEATLYPDGRIEMSGEELLVEDIPVANDLYST